MLTRRVFRQLTDSVLFNVARPPPCLATQTSRRAPLSSSALCRNHNPSFATPIQCRHASSSSSTRWKSRQSRDVFSRQSKVLNLKSRAAFKLLQIDQKHRLFKPGQTVVDLGYAPGSWSQVAISKVGSTGRVIGIDILPVQPPAGVSTIQGNFLSENVREEVRKYVLDDQLGRPKRREAVLVNDEDDIEYMLEGESYIDMERHSDLDLHHEPSIHAASAPAPHDELIATPQPPKKLSLKQRDAQAGRVVDLLLSDMMSNTSGIPFKDHAGSMDLCSAALTFAFHTLKTGGNFVCKFFAGAEDKELEKRMKSLFERVLREKPEGSRDESKEAYFICLRRKENAAREKVLGADT